MRKEIPRDSPASRPVTKPASSGKAVKRAAPSAGKSVSKKKKPAEEEVPKPNPGLSAQNDKKKKLMKPKVVLTKLPPGAQEQTKPKVVKETKKETIPKTVKPKPKKVIASKAAKKGVKLEHDPKRATKAKIVRAVKDVKKARSLVASKMAKTSTKKPASSQKAGKSVNLVKKHNIVKSVNKMSGKKPCVVSVKISNAHSTVTLSVKQNKQVAKKDNSKNVKPSNEKGSDRSTISIVKKGIASRRKSTSKDGTSQESSPSQSPTRSVSPGKGSTNKSKKSEIVKAQKKSAKEDSKKGVDDKSITSKNNDNKLDNEKTEYIINDSVKIKTENVGEQQNMEIEFTDGSITDKNNDNDSKDEYKDSSKKDDSVFEFKAKSPLRDYNLKSIESCTSDEMPLEILKSKERIKQEKEIACKKIEPKESEKKDLDRVKSDDNKKRECVTDEKQTANKKKADLGKQNKSKIPTKVQKTSKQSDGEKDLKTQDKSKEKLKGLALKQKVAKLVKKSRLTEQKQKKAIHKVDSEESSTGSSSGSTDRRRMKKLYKFWSGPKRHRVASLNALAKVHCLYENESRGALNEVISNAAILQRAIEESKKEYAASKKKGEENEKKVVTKRSVAVKKSVDIPVSRNLRTNPGVRSVGRNFDILNVISSTSLSSSSSEESSDSGEEKKQLALLPSVKQKQAQIKKEESDHTSDEDRAQKPSSESNDDTKDGTKKVKKRRRRRNELTMDLKDMVVRKRMASLNASAIMTATYSTEKKLEIKPEREKKKIEEPVKKERKKKKKPTVTPPEVEDSSADEDVILRTTNNKQKVAVIVNQDTDVTITGVYVNSTTRSTHHEGYCSIAGMQYRISSTSHTQTEATAVSTETVLHTDHPPCLPEATPTTALATPCKSYTPLNALSSMQPPGQMHHHAHPPGTCPPPRGPSLSPLQRRHGCTSAFSAPPGQHPPPPPHHDVHGYYQPAGPLISTHHHHHHTSSSSITSKLQPPPLPSPTPPPSSTHPTSHSESSDTEVVLTSASENPPPVRYSYPPHGQPYNPQYYQYYPSPPASSLQYPGQQNHYHQDICYSAPSGYPPGYYPKGHYPPPPGGYPRRYGPPHQYYPQEYYPNPPPPSGANPPPPPGGNNQQMMVSANPPSGQTSASYPPADGNYPTPAPMVDPYPPPPPQPGYYPGYSAGPPPSCYTTHSPSSRGLFLDPAYQGCPCPMQSCPKNVHTGPLTGASKGPIKNHQTTLLPPVALALPQEPPGALGPPSPARGSAGMPPPPSPALATACNPPQWTESLPAKPQLEQTGLLTISKMVTDAVMLAEQGETNLAELLPRTEPIKQEIEDIVKIEVIEDAKCNRKRRKSFKSSPVDIKRQSCEPMNESELKVEVQERLTTLKEEPEKSPQPELETVEKQLPLSDNGATVPIKNSSITVVTNCVVSKEHPKKRKLPCSEPEVPAKIAKCTKSPKKCAKKSKSVTEENIAPESELTVNAAELVKVECRRSSKPVERRKSITLQPTPSSVEQTIQNVVEDIMSEGKKKKVARTKKLQGKTKADHQLRSHGKAETSPAAIKERRHSKAGSIKSEEAAWKSKKVSAPMVAEIDPSAESQVCLPGLRRTLAPRWSNGWSWEGTPYKAKIFLNMDDKEVVRKCYPAMRHVQGDVIYPRDSILLKAGPRKIDLPFVAKVAAMWENPDDGEMMVSLLWYYRPEHTEQGRRPEDSTDEIFASRHKDTNSVACIEDKCFVLSFNEYCRYRKTVRRLEEGLSGGGMVVPALEERGYPRSAFQPPGVVAPELVFFCRRVYDFRQKRILKNPC